MTKVTVTLQYDSVEDAIVGLGNVLAGDGAQAPQPPKTDTGQVAADANKQVSAREPTKAVQELLDKHGLKAEQVPGSGKDGRVTKKDVEDYVKRQADSPGTDTEAATGETVGPDGEVEASLDDVRAALKKLNDSKGINTCREVMSRFGVNRVSELKEGQYGEFITKCDSVADGGEV